MDRTFTLTEALLIAGGAVLVALLIHGCGWRAAPTPVGPSR